MKKLLLVLGLVVLTANSVLAIDFDNIRKNTAKTVNEQVNLITAINAKQLQDERDFRKSLSTEKCRMLTHYLLVADDVKTYNNGGDSYTAFIPHQGTIYVPTPTYTGVIVSWSCTLRL